MGSRKGFLIGDRVRLTEKAIKAGIRLKKKVTTGKLVGLRPPLSLVVLPDGYKNPRSYHISFWEAI